MGDEPVDPDAMMKALRGEAGPVPGAPDKSEPDAKETTRGRPARKTPPRSSRRLGTAKRPAPDFSGLPPAMAQSLARLAGVPWPPEGGEGETQTMERASDDSAQSGDGNSET